MAGVRRSLARQQQGGHHSPAHCASLLPPALQSERRHVSLSALDHRITILFYCFSVVNTFLGNVVGSTIVQNIGAMLQQPGGLRWLAGALWASPPAGPLNPRQSVFILSFYQPGGLVWDSSPRP